MKPRAAAQLAAVSLAVAAFAPAQAHDPVRIVRTLVLEPTGASAASVAAAATACGTRGSEGNQRDVTAADQTQVIYFVPRTFCDEGLDGTPLANSMKSLNAWLVSQGARPMRLDKTSTGALDIVFLRAAQGPSAYEGLDGIAQEIGARGFNAPNKRYLIFAALDFDAVCGEAEFPGAYAAVYLNSDAGCGTRSFGNGTVSGAGKAEIVSGQEAIHNEGIVGFLAPHNCVPFLAHVCTPGLVLAQSLDPERVDLMFPFVVGLKLGAKVLDRGRDDYFKAPLAIPDLDESTFFGS